ncbi:MAG: tRNA 5-methoxyuridine(34)/uridine 5-oxyacetic acid(34) synthase CmoB [Fuerstiella sp.]|nr:tRNA 5-methoxyuridine(34)/uridine 5-oxyacetic acid(34) synthase CmoB [Fuerstiella sp.]MCP4856580.1 tRNA 5-methoxyuridine(34)/uridine 5-oxyacetic acid(34) synthase CmoB [Fuerstiella sp.]
MFDFESPFAWLRDAGHQAWAEELQHSCHLVIDVNGHGNLSDWIQCWEDLPDIDGHIDARNDGRVTLDGQISSRTESQLRSDLMKFRPWRKGPFDLFGIHIDTEWRSDWKWNRLRDHVELRDRSVLDVGCGNGYFGWQMLAAGATRVIGLDPFLLYVMQHEVIRNFAGAAQNYVLPLGDDCLSERRHLFDVTVSMGVLYHRTSPIEHLQSLYNSLQRHGQLVLETLVIDTKGEQLLMPEGRYAKMRNVWFIPSVDMLTKWLRRTGFQDVKVVDVTPTTTSEQRRTEWMTFESLSDFIDPEDSSKTVEGYPAPVRAMLTARRK